MIEGSNRREKKEYIRTEYLENTGQNSMAV